MKTTNPPEKPFADEKANLITGGCVACILGSDTKWPQDAFRASSIQCLDKAALLLEIPHFMLNSSRIH